MKISRWKQSNGRPTSLLLSVVALAAAMAWLATGFIAGAIAAANESSNAPDASDVQSSRTLRVYPESFQLRGSGDLESFVVQLTDDTGLTHDVTGAATVAMVGDSQSPVQIEGNRITPVANGQTRIVVSYEGLTAEAPITVEQAAVARPVSFMLDVMPVLMRAGCNTGGCHGSSRGKDGFRLSLFGFDPAGDYFRITRELPGRRVNLALPDESLLIQKAIGAVPHTGGKRFEAGDPLYQRLVSWLEAGAPRDEQTPPAVKRLEIYPPKAVLEGPGSEQQMVVRAVYDDGSDRDVTGLSLFLSNNDNSADINTAGRVTAGQRGEAFVMARFEAHTVGAQVIVVPQGLNYQPPSLDAVPEYNYIDTLVNAKLQKLRIYPSELCSDEVFLRRVYLDIVGMLPDPEARAAFVGSSDPHKREQLVDELLERKEFAEVWVMKWAELLQIKSGNETISYKAALLYYNWLQTRLANNVPIDQIVKELINSTGGTFKSPATNYFQIERDTLKTAENVAQVFMGMRIQCAQCHNHPFDRWTMDDYYAFSAFFSQIGRKRAEDPRETIVFDRRNGDVKHPVDDRVMAPKFLGGEQPDFGRRDRREVLAEWLASSDNPYFARNLANIVWAHFFGVGIVEPVDDVRVSNPPSNPELLDELARRFTAYNYDFKKLVRDICTSRTYQLSSSTNESNELDTRNFARSQVRRIRAEVLLDSIAQVTETKSKFRGLPLGSRAVQIADGSTTNYFLETFGRARRETVCSCEVSTDPTLSQALHLINGQETNNRIKNGGVVKRLLKDGGDPAAVIDAIYIRALSRKPTDAEREKLLAAVMATDQTEAAIEDVFWAVLNAREFIFNH